MVDQKKIDLARGLLMAALHEINNVCAVLQSLSATIKDGRPMPSQWDADFWSGQAAKLKKASGQAAKLKKASDNVGQAKNALMGW